LAYDSLAQLRQVLVTEFPHLSMIDQVPINDWSVVASGKLGTGAFGGAVDDYYLSNPIARASALMAELSSKAKARIIAPMAAE
jgi:NADH-quinone oxidoreductase subunit G